MENTKYGDSEDQVGVSRLLQNSSFTAAFPLHDVRNNTVITRMMDY